MNCSFRSLLAFSVCTVACAGVASSQNPETRVCIRIYDMSHVPQKTLSWATLQAGKIFRRASDDPNGTSPGAETCTEDRGERS
jgi:hypothetical protein